MLYYTLIYDYIVPKCRLHSFPLCPAEGSRPHRIIKLTSLGCMCVCVCVHTGVQKCIYVCSICMWAYVHLHVCGASLRWLLTCAVVIVVTFLSSSLQKVLLELETKQKMTPAYVCAPSIHCLSLCSLHHVSRAQKCKRCPHQSGCRPALIRK